MVGRDPLLEPDDAEQDVLLGFSARTWQLACAEGTPR
jgi:hypothetical protein